MNESTILFLIVIAIALLVLVYLSERQYNLNQFKSKTVGDGQHGTARFATESEIKHDYVHQLFDVSSWRKGLHRPTITGTVLGHRKKGLNQYALVDTGDTHTLMIGAAGIGKTAYFLYPNLEFACASGMSFLTTDTKGDIFRNYATIAQKYYGYNISVIDLRNPLASNHFNMLHLVNRYMDEYLSDKSKLYAKAKAEKYAKIISKTIINAGNENANYGQNQFFYDSAEGLLTSVILILAEYGEKDSRHIVSVCKMIQELTQIDPLTKTMGIKKLIKKLPSNHKARWYAGAALNASDGSMFSILSTTLSRLNAFIDSELEQLLCFETDIDAEKFCNEKCALFIVLPEEDSTKYFLVSLMIQQLYREILVVADEQNGKLNQRVMFYLDEVGTLPKIESAEMMFSASRSRGLSIIAIIQSLAQLNKNYGNEGAEIIIDNCQNSIFGGFAPNSKTAEVLSKNLGCATILSGSVSKGSNQESRSVQMIERPLMTSDELKSMGKGTFIVMKTGTNPMKTKLPLYTKWGIVFEEIYDVPYTNERTIKYIDMDVLNKAVGRLNVEIKTGGVTLE